MQECKSQDKAVVWVTVGDSGLGKSSFVNLFCDKKAAVSDGTFACTKSIACFESKYKDKEGRKVLLIDTVGYNDSDGIEEIAIATLRFINEQKIDSVIVFWFKACDVKASASLQRQAKIIDSFRQNEIWNSCIIVVKQATPKTLIKYSQGAIEAISKVTGLGTCDIENQMPRLGYRCIDWLSKEELEEIEETTDKSKFQDLNILNEEDIRQLVLKTVGTIKDCQIIFRNHQCIKCGEIGDPRCLSALCHFGDKAKRHHPKMKEFKHKNETVYYKHGALSAILKHTKNELRKEYSHAEGGKLEREMKRQVIYEHVGSIEKYHKGNEIACHISSAKEYHSGEFESYHSDGAEWYHDGSMRRVHIDTCKTMKFHDGEYNVCFHSGQLTRSHNAPFDWKQVRRMVASVLTVGISTLWMEGEYPCCHGSYDSVGCKAEYSCCGQAEGNVGCVTRWSCCSERNVDGDGCKTRWNCGSAFGCQERMSCCNEAVGLNQGCKRRYICCLKDMSDNGCKKRWTCCQSKNEDNKGCKHRWQCCNSEVIDGNLSRVDNPNGCQKLCSQCGNSWHKQRSKGCGVRYTCCKKEGAAPSNDQGCVKREKMIEGELTWTCCHKGEKSQGCIETEYYQCCGKEKGCDGCQSYFECCNKFKYQDNKNGCIAYYKCCNNNATNGDLKDGCVIACCQIDRLKANNEENGCQEICSKCNGKWNDSNVPGCGDIGGQDYYHDTRQI